MDLEGLQRRTLRVLIGAQVFGGAGFFLGVAVGVLLARELTDSDSLIGLPTAIAVAGAFLGGLVVLMALRAGLFAPAPAEAG